MIGVGTEPANGTFVPSYPTKKMSLSFIKTITYTMLFRGSDWFTANSASSKRVDTPNLSKILLR